MKNEKLLREQLVTLLEGGEAHMLSDEAVSDFPQKLINVRPPHVQYTFWQLLEHIRRTQWDILDFMVNPNYKEPKWPDDYWPKKGEIATKKDWEESIKSFQKDLKKLIKIAKDPKTDLSSKIPNGTGQTILRELLLVADHNSYCIGEFAILRQVMQAWPKGRKG